MIPEFCDNGNLPPGIHWATWGEVKRRFGWNHRRQELLSGLELALESLKGAGCATVYIDGSFVTGKDVPGDFDACWETANVVPAALDPVFMRFDNGRAAQKAKFLGELFPNFTESSSRKKFLEFFQVDKLSGEAKGIIAIDLRRFP